MSALISAHDKCWPFNTTLCFLQLKKPFIKVISSLDILFCCNVNSKPSCQTLSSTLDISILWPSSNHETISCATDTNWLVQETSGLNPDYFGDIKSFSKKNENMLFQRNRSNNLLQTGRKETRW